MSLTNENGNNGLVMPVAPMYGGGYGNNNNGWGGDNAWWLILFLIFGWGWGGNGFGGGFGGGSGIQGALTRGDLCQDMNFQDLQNGVRNVSDAVNLGFANLNSTVCHQEYETAQMINGVTAAVNGGFQALNSTICQNAYENAGLINGLSNTIQSGFNAQNIAALQTANAQNVANLQSTNAIQNQIATCCCDEKAALENVRFTIAQEDCQTRQTISDGIRAQMENCNANTRAILEKLTAQEIAAKDAQIAAQNQRLFAAELAASQSAQNAYLINTLRPTPVPAYPASSPCGYNWSPSVLAGGYGVGNGCGCNC